MSEFITAGGNTSAEAREWATKEGLTVRTPADNELFIDIDNSLEFDQFVRNYDIVDRFAGIQNVFTTPSRSKPEGKHIVVILYNKITPLERIALQAILGSDRRREGHSIIRLQDGDREPTLFFEKA